MAQVEYETINVKEIKFGRNSFLEIARKKAKTEEGENEFVSLAKGFYQPDGTKRFKDNFTLPKEPELLKQIADEIQHI